MSNAYSSLLTLEGGLAVVFFGVMLVLWRKVDVADAGLWVFLWATRVFASLKAVQNVPEASGELGMFVGLQACSALALIMVLARSELRVLRERLVRRLYMQVAVIQPSAPRVD